ncbi:fluoride efflux transporter CrcB [Maribacter sp. 2210JD10-5]|uniref:fluoride efflux transporter CrcB n=1 Tax=Maribacter sp. 2210JD10-5 TaxID=3386272 RepID=UPI0039BC72FD
MKPFLLVFFGGGIGSVLRYWVSKSLNHYYPNFYLGTFAVNIIGCLLIGILLGISLKQNFIGQNQMLFLATGFCGGFTTFSSFAMEGQTLLKEASLLHFSFYTIASIAVGVFAVSLGLYICRLL